MGISKMASGGTRPSAWLAALLILVALSYPADTHEVVSLDGESDGPESFLELEKKGGAKKADPPYKKWAEEAKAFPKKHLKAPSPQQKKSKKKAPVTKKDIKKYAGNTGDVTQMEIEDKELRAKAKWGGMYRKVNHKSIMHKKEVKAKKEKKIVIHHYGRWKRRIRGGR